MGQYYESILRQGTPTAAITMAMFQKIDRPIMLAGPSVARNAAAVLIDQHHGSGLDDRRHRPVFEATFFGGVVLNLCNAAASRIGRGPATEGHQKNAQFTSVQPGRAEFPRCGAVGLPVFHRVDRETAGLERANRFCPMPV